MRAQFALLAMLLLAGCATAPAPEPQLTTIEDRVACHEADPVPSQTAPLAPGFVGDPEEVLARLAAALGVVPMSDIVEVEPTAWTQWTNDGEIRLERFPGVAPFGAQTYVGWTGNVSWSPTEAQMRERVEALTTAFGAKPATLAIAPLQGEGRLALEFRQSHQGVRLGDAGGELYAGARPTLSMHALRDLPTAPPAVSEAEARAIAEPHARCVLDASGRTQEAGYATKGVEGSYVALHGDSLVHAVVVLFEEPGEPSHCGMSILVHVDATNGAVLGAGRPPCD